jgi:hypothetical protein
MNLEYDKFEIPVLQGLFITNCWVREFSFACYFKYGGICCAYKDCPLMIQYNMETFTVQEMVCWQIKGQKNGF